LSLLNPKTYNLNFSNALFIFFIKNYYRIYLYMNSYQKYLNKFYICYSDTVYTNLYNSIHFSNFLIPTLLLLLYLNKHYFWWASRISNFHNCSVNTMYLDSTSNIDPSKVLWIFTFFTTSFYYKTNINRITILYLHSNISISVFLLQRITLKKQSNFHNFWNS
jgi:hypothetical protein